MAWSTKHIQTNIFNLYAIKLYAKELFMISNIHLRIGLDFLLVLVFQFGFYNGFHSQFQQTFTQFYHGSKFMHFPLILLNSDFFFR